MAGVPAPQEVVADVRREGTDSGCQAVRDRHGVPTGGWGAERCLPVALGNRDLVGGVGPAWAALGLLVEFDRRGEALVDGDRGLVLGRYSFQEGQSSRNVVKAASASPGPARWPGVTVTVVSGVKLPPRV